jgi:cell shape-determining protein MreC
MTVTRMFSLNKSSSVALFLAVYVSAALNVVDRSKQVLKSKDEPGLSSLLSNILKLSAPSSFFYCSFDV